MTGFTIMSEKQFREEKVVRNRDGYRPHLVRTHKRIQDVPVGQTRSEFIAGHTNSLTSLADEPTPEHDTAETGERAVHPRLAPLTDLIVSGRDLPKTAIMLANNTEPSLDAVQPATNKGWCKPEGGMWSAPLLTENHSGTPHSAWSQWCIENEFQPKDNEGMTLWAMEVPDDAVVLRVDTTDDGSRVYDQFFEGEKGEAPRYFLPVDFEGLAESGVDAIWLTEDGAWDAGSGGASSEGAPFAMWDCETVLWLRPPKDATFTKLGEIDLSGHTRYNF